MPGTRNDLEARVHETGCLQEGKRLILQINLAGKHSEARVLQLSEDTRRC